MMGQDNGFQAQLFYHQVNLEQRVPKNHSLIKIQEPIDFDFIYSEVREFNTWEKGIRTAYMIRI